MTNEAYIEQAETCVQEIRSNFRRGNSQKVALRLEELFDLCAQADETDAEAIKRMITAIAVEIASAGHA